MALAISHRSQEDASGRAQACPSIVSLRPQEKPHRATKLILLNVLAGPEANGLLWQSKFNLLHLTRKDDRGVPLRLRKLASTLEQCLLAIRDLMRQVVPQRTRLTRTTASVQGFLQGPYDMLHPEPKPESFSK
uniref:Uncharacterized protein n=1 Tax=Fusarium oxysporum (strain Fo5176) TaxID=660025 RepID=A0A0D2XFU4_FUSOF